MSNIDACRNGRFGLLLLAVSLQGYLPQAAAATTQSTPRLVEQLEELDLPSSQVAELLARARNHAVPAGNIDLWVTELAHMRADNLPLEPGLDLILQGLSKNASSQQIHGALRSLRSDLSWASDLLHHVVNGEAADPVLLNAFYSEVESGLRSGFTTADLAAVIGHQSELAMAVARLNLANNLRIQGLRPDWIARLYREASPHLADTRELNRLQAQIDRDMDCSSAPPEQVVRQAFATADRGQ